MLEQNQFRKLNVQILPDSKRTINPEFAVNIKKIKN